MSLKLVICVLLITWIPSWSFMLRSRTNALRLNRLGHAPFTEKRVKTVLSMAVKTYLSADSSFEARCTSANDENVSLSEYMRLPVEQYASLKMPLNASLKRINNRQFKLVIPSVKLFHLDVSPIMICDVVQTPQSVEITSNHCILSGSEYVDGLNGCFKFDVATKIQWTDTPAKSAIQSLSKISLEVDPPHPFKFVGKKILESTGMVALNAIIESAFVHSLAEDYERWAKDPAYRVSRSKISGAQTNNNIPCPTTTGEVESSLVVTEPPPINDVESVVESVVEIAMKKDLATSTQVEDTPVIPVVSEVRLCCT